MRMWNKSWSLLAVGVLAASCGSSAASVASSTTTTAKSNPTTTTTTQPSDLSPLTGLPYANPSYASRPALAAKIDNASQAWPQSGLRHADIIYEEMVEGGLTRYMAVFQSQNASVLGPIRSVRASDADIASPLRGFFAYSGGIPTFVKDIRASGVKDVGVYVLGNAYYRLSSRQAPHNLYTSTKTIYADAKKAGITAGPPPRLFYFRKPGTGFTALGAKSVSTFTSTISGSAINKWTWNPTSGKWDRTTNGVPQRNAAGLPEDASNVIIEFVDYTNTGFVDPAGNPVPQAHSVGSGKAIFLSGGKEAKGTWSKASESSVTQFADSSGQTIKLAPGRTWVEFAPIGSSTSSS